jgi:hypothetical protein
MDVNEDLLNDLYRYIATEMSSGNIDDGLWLRALTEADNNQESAKAKYTKLRITELSRDLEKTRDILQAEEEKNATIQKEAKKILDKAAKDTKGFTLFRK